MIDRFRCKKTGLFLGGILFGTTGVKILGGDDAKKLYINCLAAGLKAKNYVMTTASNIQENAEGILAEARETNVQRCQEVFEDENREESSEHTSGYSKEDEIVSVDTATA